MSPMERQAQRKLGSASSVVMMWQYVDTHPLPVTHVTFEAYTYFPVASS
jgi:hypothetical protein